MTLEDAEVAECRADTFSDAVLHHRQACPDCITAGRVGVPYPGYGRDHSPCPTDRVLLREHARARGRARILRNRDNRERGIRCGSRVEAGTGSDHDVGTVVEVRAGAAGGDMAVVAWDSVQTTLCPVALLRPSETPRDMGRR